MGEQVLSLTRQVSKITELNYRHLLVGKVICAIGFVFALSGPVAAQSGGDIPGASDHPILDRFPESSIVAYRTSTKETYQLVLGSMRRVAREIVPEQSERIRADITRITYEVSSSFDGVNVYEFIRQQAQDKGYKALYDCRGQACGNSTYWANTAFANRILSGPDRNQFYMVFDTSSSTGIRSYLSAYIITRGNRRLYAHIEIAETMEGSQESQTYSVAGALSATGSAVLNTVSFDDQDRFLSDEGIAALADYLQRNSQMNVYLVGHLNAEAELEVLIDRSRARAQQVSDKLVQQGISAQRINVQGLGPLAPNCTLSSAACLERIEVIEQRQVP